MSARSSLHSAVLAALVLAGCGHKAKKAPEADPQKASALFLQMYKSFPGPGFTECKNEDMLGGGATMTGVTFYRVAGQPIPDRPEYADYVNPQELDSPATHTLVDDKASTTDKRRAAAELLAAPFYLVYLVDLVNAPMALEVKELKRGTVGARAVRFDKSGRPVCVRPFFWQNDKAVSDDAIAKSNKARIDPAIAKALQADLRAELLKRIPKLSQPQEPGEIMPRIPDGINQQ